MKVFNTLSGRKEDFAPANAPTVTMYVCGVTPYSSAHMGHAMSYIIFDVIRRYLEFRGYEVRHVQNFTDIDDKLIDRGARLDVGPLELAERHIEEFFSEMDALNVTRAGLYPRATEEVPKIIEVVQGLIDAGYAYEANGDVYFRVQKDPDYGKLSHRALEGMLAGARVLPGEAKQHPMDFALWKAAKEGEPEWASPWGPGRPGWHIECSAMALRHLGDTIDIHGGGADLVFPHHENEIAQSEAFTGQKPFVRFWLHNGLMQMGEEKMSKSLGNLITLREGLERYGADALRVFVLSGHYRSPLTFSEEAVAAAARGAERLRHAASDETDARAPGSSESGGTVDDARYRERFVEAMDDDFNTAQALAALFDLAREINRAGAARDAAAGRERLRDLAGVLGLTLRGPDDTAANAAPFIDLLVETRAGLRQARQFELADQIRDRLAGLGVTLEDGPKGTRWKLRPGPAG